MMALISSSGYNAYRSLANYRRRVCERERERERDALGEMDNRGKVMEQRRILQRKIDFIVRKLSMSSLQRQQTNLPIISTGV